MTQLADWLSPVTLRVLALALLHFLWQGAALAALAYLAMAFCRSAAARYAVGVGTLALMLAAPVASLLILEAQNEGGAALEATAQNSNAAAVPVPPVLAQQKHAPENSGNSGAYLLWLVEAWFAGVLLLSLRAAGGFLLVEHWRHKEAIPVAKELLEMCLSLQRRMGITQLVRCCESVRLDAPAVAGWIRPVVFLPMTAITGLTGEQLEAVLAHELAHIRRHDVFVHAFQVAVETLLFYHPAVWWMGKRIRAEREHCCDDAAVATCGNAVMYANALARMAEWKTAPRLVMAANRSPLVQRVARLLGAKQPFETIPAANLSAGVLCLLTALLAGSAFLGNVHHAQAQTPAPAAPAQSSSAAVAPAPTHVPRVPDTAFLVRPSEADSEMPVVAAPAPVAGPTLAPAATSAAPPAPSAAAPAPAPQTAPSAPRQSYIDSLKDAGLTNLSVDQLIGLKVQGVTGEYVKAMRDAGLKTDVDELIGMKVQGITPEYVEQMRTATGETLDTDALIGMKVQGVTPEYVREMHDLGVKLDTDEIIGLKVQGVTPEYVREMRSLGLKADSDEIIGMKIQGITAEYVKAIQEAGFRPDTDELIGMKVQGVTADYLKELQSAGLKVDINDAIGAKIQAITPEFIAKARSHGFKDLTLDKLIQLKNSGVLDDAK
jgi:bla regulator protein blaR1